MSPSRLPIFLTLIWLIGFFQNAVGNPLRPLDNRDSLRESTTGQHTKNLAISYDHLQRHYHDQSHVDATRAASKRTVASDRGFRLVHRYQQSAIIPGASGAAALKGFWQLVSMKALYNNALGEKQEQLFTITEGVLQATFSCFGSEIPWGFVQDFAMKLAGMVDRGWTDTFDMAYEQEATGFVYWVSLRVLIRARRRETGSSGG